MLLHQIVGQHILKERLVQMVQQNRLSHAMMIIGKEGTGTLPLAIALASYIACIPKATQVSRSSSLFDTAPSETIEKSQIPHPDEIGSLLAFQKAAKLIHPDIHFSFPVVIDEKKKKRISKDYMPEWREFITQMPYGNIYDWLQFIGVDNKQGNISAEECIDIIHKLSLKSFESSWKILIMWMPEYLGKEGNKLLKLIEEPPSDTLFLLVAENEDAILPTILSRCQIIRTAALENTEIENELIQRGIDLEKAKQVASNAEGNFHTALQLLQQGEEDWQTLLRQWLNAAIKGTPKMQLEWIGEMNDLGREKQKQFLKYFTRMLEQSIRTRVLTPAQLSLPKNEMDFAQRINKITGINQQMALVKELEMAIYYIERNANSKMLFHALTLKLRSIVLEKMVLLQNG